jgi:hypothetical protein
LIWLKKNFKIINCFWKKIFLHDSIKRRRRRRPLFIVALKAHLDSDFNIEKKNVEPRLKNEVTPNRKTSNDE